MKDQTYPTGTFTPNKARSLMTEARARAILKDWIQPDGDLYRLGKYTFWKRGDKKITLDSDFTAKELEAIAYWMRNKPKAEAPHS